MFVFGIKSLQETRVNLPKARMARAILRARTSEIRQGKAGRKVFIFFLKIFSRVPKEEAAAAVQALSLGQ